MNRPVHRLLCGLIASGSLSVAAADLSVWVALEPTQRKEGLMISRPGLESSLGTLLNAPVSATSTEDLTDTLRATRSAAHAIFIAPPQVAASALTHGYELLGSTDPQEEYVLVGRPTIASASALKAGRIYLPQQDSIYTYMARGMLTANGLSFKDLAKVEFARLPQAGLAAVTLGVSECTVVRKRDWDEWQQANPGRAKVLASSGPVPGGLSVVVRKDVPPEQRARLVRWFGSSAQTAGLKNLAAFATPAHYERVAQLGTFTPTALPGAKVVAAAEVRQLIDSGAVVVDTRTEKEFNAKRLPGARFVPYAEKSLKDVAYDAALDDFSGLKSLDPSKPTVFHCNGAECWKSYKATKAALTAGFRQVYWFRGGLPEWEKAGMPLDREAPRQATATR